MKLWFIVLFLSLGTSCTAQNIQKTNVEQVYVHESNNCPDSLPSYTFLIFLKSDSIASFSVSCFEGSAFWLDRNQKIKKIFKDFIKGYNSDQKVEYLDDEVIQFDRIGQDSVVSRKRGSIIISDYTEKFWSRNDSLYSKLIVGDKVYRSGYVRLSKW